MQPKEVLVRDKVWTRANVWTISGIIGLSFVALQVYLELWTVLIPLVFMYSAGVTDLMDGLSANKRDEHTFVGAWLDPARDRYAALVTAFAVFSVAGASPATAAPIAVVVFCEIAAALKNKKRSRVHLLGKLRYGIHGIAATLLFISWYWAPLAAIAVPGAFVPALLWAMASGSILALVVYSRAP